MSRETLTISVALCTHNGARFVAEQLTSILKQSVLPSQIVVSDDESKDDTVAIIEHTFAEWTLNNGATPITLTVLKNSPALGLVRNFDQATAACAGTLIALCDQDDIWTVDRLEKFLSVFEADASIMLVSSDARLIDGDGMPLGVTLFNALAVTSRDVELLCSVQGYRALLRRNLVTGATAVFRRDILSAASPFPVEWIHDEWLAIISATIGRLEVIPDQLVDYRQHAGNTIGVKPLSFATVRGRLTESRGARNEALVMRAQVLLQRLADMPEVPIAVIGSVRAKVAHEGFRLDLPASRLLRIAPVLREARAGGYRDYGRGVRDMVRDIVQPV